MNREQLLREIRALLAKAGFYVSEICNIRPSSCDFFARKDNLLLILKVLNNIDALTVEVAEELRLLSTFLDGIPLVVGMKSSTRTLEEGVVYLRHKVPIINFVTFEDYARGTKPIICAAPGGLYANLDEKRIHQLRMERKISLGTLARVAGVSRRTIRMYEKGERASIQTVIKMEEFFEESIIRPIEFYEFMEAEMEVTRRQIEEDILVKLKQLGLEITPTMRCPFDAISEILENAFLVTIKKDRLMERAKLIANISKVVEKQSVFFVERTVRKNLEGIPLIQREELARIREPERLVDLILERQ
jgi:putative transcriptional regulator